METNYDCPICKRSPCMHGGIQMERWDAAREEPGSLVGAPGETGQYSTLTPEPIEIIEAWTTSYHIGNVIKYVARWEKKGGIEDLEKARWYLDRFIRLQRTRASQG